MSSNFKVIWWETNYNSKLGNGGMVHIDQAPGTPIPESKMWDKFVEIRTKDGSCEPTFWLLTDVMKIPLEDVSSLYTIPSHGISSNEFIFQELVKGLSRTTPLMVYVYRKTE